MTDVHTTDTKREAAKKPAKGKKAKARDVVTLAELCKELKIAPVLARVKLRAAVADKKIKHEAKSAWLWKKGSDALVSARKLLSGD